MSRKKSGQDDSVGDDWVDSSVYEYAINLSGYAGCSLEDLADGVRYPKRGQVDSKYAKKSPKLSELAEGYPPMHVQLAARALRVIRGLKAHEELDREQHLQQLPESMFTLGSIDSAFWAAWEKYDEHKTNPSIEIPLALAQEFIERKEARERSISALGDAKAKKDAQEKPLRDARDKRLCEIGKEFKDLGRGDPDITKLVSNKALREQLWEKYPPSEPLSDKRVREILRSGGVIAPANRKSPK